MEQNQLDTFRAKLISLRQEIWQLNTDCKDAAGTVALDQSKVGRLSRMDALQAQQMAMKCCVNV
jgi:DnaK suppressor protein